MTPVETRAEVASAMTPVETRADKARDAILGIGVVSLTFSVALMGETGIVSVGMPVLAFGLLASTGRLWPGFVRRRHPLVFDLALLYLCCVILSLFWSKNPLQAGWRVAMHVVGFVLWIYLVGAFATRGQAVVRRWALILALSGVAMACHFLGNLLYLLLSGSIEQALVQRYSGGLMSLQWGASNTVAAALIFPILGAMLLATTHPRAWRLCVAMAAIMLLAIMATMSRNALGSLLIAGAVYAALQRRLQAFVGAVAVFGAMAALFAWAIGGDAFDLVMDIRSGSSGYRDRLDLWRRGWGYLLQTFPKPIGFYGSMHRFEVSSHNFLFSYVIEIGAWGLAAFIGLVAASWRELHRERRRIIAAGAPVRPLDVCLAGFVAMLVNISFEDPQYTQPYIIFFWVFLALALARSLAPEQGQVATESEPLPGQGTT